MISTPTPNKDISRHGGSKSLRNIFLFNIQLRLAASFFGPFGAYAGMNKFRHKTQKLKFKLISVFLIIQVLVVIFLLVYLVCPDIIS